MCKDNASAVVDGNAQRDEEKEGLMSTLPKSVATMSKVRFKKRFRRTARLLRTLKIGIFSAKRMSRSALAIGVPMRSGTKETRRTYGAISLMSFWLSSFAAPGVAMITVWMPDMRMIFSASCIPP